MEQETGIKALNLSEKFPLITTFTIISIAMLLAGIPKFFPYGYYTLLRLVVCGTSCCIAYAAFSAEKKSIGVPSILVAVLFNPMIPIHLDKDMWVVLDIIVAIFFVITIFGLNCWYDRGKYSKTCSPPETALPGIKCPDCGRSDCIIRLDAPTNESTKKYTDAWEALAQLGMFMGVCRHCGVALKICLEAGRAAHLFK